MTIRPMQGEELSNLWVGSFTNCCKPYDEVRASSCILSGVLVSKAHHDLERAYVYFE